jgi:hypothetical protein
MMSISAAAQTPPAPLVLEAKIPLGQVGGRIDHLAVDVKRQRLFVAELGNNSLGVVDLANRKLLRRITGLSEPQGVGYEPVTDSVYVANANDGSVRVFSGEDLSALGRIELGDDADNVRIDPARKRVIVGSGSGALAIIDPATRTKIGEIRTQAHPESFQIDGDRVFINVPKARAIEIADLANGEVAGVVPTRLNGANFAMAVDREAHRFIVVFRDPARLLVMSAADGSTITSLDTCGDADDVFVDAKRHRVYVTCGAGVVDVFAEDGGGYRRIGQVPTVSGARTALFVPDFDRLFVAVRAVGAEPAAVWVFRPAS